MKKSLKNGLFAAVLSLGFLSANAQSDQKRERKEPPTYAELIKEMDANEDGKLSEYETKGPLKKRFSKIDTDEDGFITEEEFKNAPKPKRKERGRK